MDFVKLGQRIRSARHATGLNQADIARAAGLSRNTLVKLETGAAGDGTTFDAVVRIARVLRLSLDELTRGCL